MALAEAPERGAIRIAGIIAPEMDIPMTTTMRQLFGMGTKSSFL
jgi:hypothetical protein